MLKQEQLRREAEREEELAQMTPEEKLAEKLRIQKLQEESDLKTALETFGIAEKGKGIIDHIPDKINCRILLFICFRY